MPRKPRRARLDRDNATRRVSLIVRAKGFCERCGMVSGPFDHAHIVKREYSWTRTDERNGWCLCRPCHNEVDSYKRSFNALVEATIGWELFDQLEEKSRCRDRFDWAAEVERLKAFRKELAR